MRPWTSRGHRTTANVTIPNNTSLSPLSPRTSLARGQVAGVVHPADKRGQTADKQIGSRRGLQRELAFVFLTSDTLQLFQGRGNPRAFRQLPDARPRASTWEPHMEASKRSTNTAACSTWSGVLLIFFNKFSTCLSLESAKEGKCLTVPRNFWDARICFSSAAAIPR